MCRSIARIVKIDIPFNGSAKQKSLNLESHTWRVVDLEQRYGVKNLPKITECQKCKVVADTIPAEWPCGMAPSPISLDEYQYMQKRKSNNN